MISRPLSVTVRILALLWFQDQCSSHTRAFLGILPFRMHLKSVGSTERGMVTRLSASYSARLFIKTLRARCCSGESAWGRTVFLGILLRLLC